MAHLSGGEAEGGQAGHHFVDACSTHDGMHPADIRADSFRTLIALRLLAGQEESVYVVLDLPDLAAMPPPGSLLQLQVRRHHRHSRCCHHLLTHVATQPFHAPTCRAWRRNSRRCSWQMALAWSVLFQKRWERSLCWRTPQLASAAAIVWSSWHTRISASASRSHQKRTGEQAVQQQRQRTCRQQQAHHNLGNSSSVADPADKARAGWQGSLICLQ